jgi:hypothetical protein
VNVVVEWLTLMLRTLDVPGSNLAPETGYRVRVFCNFPQSLQANVGLVPLN